MNSRLSELLDRFVAVGNPIGRHSASELHEVVDGVCEIDDECSALKVRVSRLLASVHAAHGLLSPFDGQSIPSPSASSVYEATQILKNALSYGVKLLPLPGGVVDRSNTPLRAEVRNGVLTIEIGIETLVWAAHLDNGGPITGCEVDKRQPLVWSEDVVREMIKENEIGESPLGKFLDQMMENAANNGSAAIIFPKP